MSNARICGIDCVIPNYNGQLQCKKALLSLGDQLPITVVDDASTDNSAAILMDEFPEVNIIARKTNGGFSASVNDGIKATHGEFILLLNNDVEVTPGFLDNIIPLFVDETVFAVSPKILLPNRDNLDEGCKTGFWHHGMFYTDQRVDVNKITPVLYTTACAAVYRRSMIEALEGFDEAYSPFYWEDTDLGFRAWKRGWKSLYQPAGIVYHQHSASISKIKASYTDQIKARNSLFFIWRNIEDQDLLLAHRRWLALVLAKKVSDRDWSYIKGWSDAWKRRSEAQSAKQSDSTHRKLSDREIFRAVGIEV